MVDRCQVPGLQQQDLDAARQTQIIQANGTAAAGESRQTELVLSDDSSCKEEPRSLTSRKDPKEDVRSGSAGVLPTFAASTGGRFANGVTQLSRPDLERDLYHPASSERRPRHSLGVFLLVAAGEWACLIDRAL